jgi:16S rRNA (guanine(966)-N(2))-methyltransferase RsmD
MRVIRGKYRGRKFSPPKNFPSRPTTDYAKESLFNILENKVHFEDSHVLDLFAGTGNISLEFLSRGALSVLSIDSSFVSFKFMKKALNEIGIENWKVIKNDVFKYAVKIERQYEIVFADPPFGLKEIYKIPTLVFESNLIKDDGLLIIEHGKETDYKDATNFVETRNYGGVNFSFFAKS